MRQMVRKSGGRKRCKHEDERLEGVRNEIVEAWERRSAKLSMELPFILKIHRRRRDIYKMERIWLIVDDRINCAKCNEQVNRILNFKFFFNGFNV